MCWSHHRDWAEDHREARRDERRTESRRTDPVSTPDDLRVSDAERDAVVALLRRHVGDGRLTLDEFETRVDDVMRARTGADLRAVLVDLPPLTEPVREERHRARRQPVGVFSPLLVLVGVLITISLMVGQFVIWPLFVFFFCGFGRRRHRRWDAAS